MVGNFYLHVNTVFAAICSHLNATLRVTHALKRNPHTTKPEKTLHHGTSHAQCDEPQGILLFYFYQKDF
jgi:hypothetical protein